MYQNLCALEAGSSLDQALAAYREEHRLEHDDTEVEHGEAGFRDPEDAITHSITTLYSRK